jgi:hypothetical protein
MRHGRMGAVTRRYLSFPEGTGLLVVQLDARVKPELVETVAANKISKSHDGIDEH